MVDRLRSALSALGAILTGAGVLILLFVAYQLWGTGLYTSRQQDSLRSQFKQKAKVVDSAQRHDRRRRSTPLHLPPPPPSGESVANIRIPKIGVDKYVVQGVGLADLRKGRATTPRRRCPVSRATPPSPVTARRTARPSTGSTSWRRATTSSSPR